MKRLSSKSSTTKKVSCSPPSDLSSCNRRDNALVEQAISSALLAYVRSALLWMSHWKNATTKR